MQKLPAWRIIATVAGVTLTGIEVFGAVEYLLKQEGHVSYIVAGGAVVTATSAFLPFLAERLWRRGHYFQALLFWAALLPALSLIFSAAIERTGGARDLRGQERQTAAQRIVLAREALSDAKAELAEAEAQAGAECASGRGKRCRSLEQRAEAARARVSAARDGVQQAGVAPRDPQAVRIAALLPWVSEDQVALYQPVILPVTVSVLGILLLGAGLSEPKRKRKAPVVKARKTRKVKPRTVPPTPVHVPIRSRGHLSLVASNDP